MTDIPNGSRSDRPEDQLQIQAQVAALILQARSHVGEGNYPGALSNLNIALHLQPLYVAALTYRGLVYACLEQDALALADYAHSLTYASASEEALVYYYRGLLYGRQRECGKAYSDFSHALEKEPGNQTYREALVEAWRECNGSALCRMVGSEWKP
jgi:tetratricopeptide (TPR) repeat protein